MLLSSLESAKFDLATIQRQIDEERNKDDEYAECIKSKPCENDGKDYSKLTEEEKHKTYHCRVKRHLECSVPKEYN